MINGQTILFFAAAAFSLLSGILSDLYGRLTILYANWVINAIFAVLWLINNNLTTIFLAIGISNCYSDVYFSIG